MRRFKRYRIALGGRVRWLLLLGVAAYLFIRLADRLLIAPLTAVAETEARLRGVDAINRIALGSVGQTLKSGELVTFVKDQDGRIAAFNINTQAVNHIASQAAIAVQGEFRRLSEQTFAVPLGAFTGSSLLSTLGPDIKVKLVPVGSVVVDIKQDFRAEGINQTRHSIWLRATATVQMVLPMITKVVVVAADMPITDTVIIGPVPSSFYGGSVGGVSLPAPTDQTSR